MTKHDWRASELNEVLRLCSTHIKRKYGKRNTMRMDGWSLRAWGIGDRLPYAKGARDYNSHGWGYRQTRETSIGGPSTTPVHRGITNSCGERVSEASWNMEQQRKSIRTRVETTGTLEESGGDNEVWGQRDAISAKRTGTGTGMSIEQLGTDLGRERTRENLKPELYGGTGKIEVTTRCKDSDACTMKGTPAGIQNAEKREGGNDVGRRQEQEWEEDSKGARGVEGAA
ncbi:hypothetical protein C8F01DRAFT_1084614 [Mycena amicta]|nr:hypothetical protein C8F01DRAFT_1084614 [Mycena amicta]